MGFFVFVFWIISGGGMNAFWCCVDLFVDGDNLNGTEWGRRVELSCQ